MSIVKALNELSGKEANTIEKAIRNIELGGGSGGGMLAVQLIFEEQETFFRAYLSKTWREMQDAMLSDKIVAIYDVDSDDSYSVTNCYYVDRIYADVDSTPNFVVHFIGCGWLNELSTDDPDGYPEYVEDTTQQEPEGQ